MFRKVLFSSIFSRYKCGMEFDYKFIITGFYNFGDIDLARKKCVVMFADDFAIERYGANCIQTVKRKEVFGVGGFWLMNKDGAVLPIRMIDPLAARFVHFVKWIVDDALSDEIKMHISGNLSW